MVVSGQIELKKVDTQENVADALTKLMSIEKLVWCREAMGLVSSA